MSKAERTTKRVNKKKISASTKKQKESAHGLIARSRLALVPISSTLTSIASPEHLAGLARVSGVVVTSLGMIYTLYFAQLYWAADVVAVAPTTQVAQLISDDNLSTTDTSNAEQPAAIFSFTPVKPLRDTVRIDVYVPDATNVNLSLFEETYRQHHALGEATQVAPDRWVYYWDTTSYRDSSYRVVADITNFYTKQDTYRSSHHTYLVLDNTYEPPVTTTEEETEKVEETKQVEENVVEPKKVRPEASLVARLASPTSGTVPLRVQIIEAEKVELYAVPLRSEVRQFLGKATEVREGEWLYQFNTTQTPNGKYRLVAAVTNKFGTYNSNELTVTIENDIQVERSAAEEQQVETIEQEYREVEKTLQLETESNLDAESETVEEEQATSTTLNQEAFDRFWDTEFAKVEAEVRILLHRLNLAYRNQSESDIAAIETQLDQIKYRLEQTVAKEYPTISWQQAFELKFTQAVAEKRDQIKKVTKYIEERNRININEDSDGDNVTDFDEVTIYKTDPYNPDSDGDGVLDGVEILQGTDPLVADADPVLYESPQEFGVLRDDILAVQHIEASATGTASTTASVETDTATAPTLRGVGLPNSFITLYVFSEPVIVTLRTREDGSWQYRFNKELEDGTHTAYAAMTDHAGRVVAKSQPFQFIKEAQAFTQVEVAAASANQNDESSLLSRYMLYLVMSLSVLSLGLILLLVGWYVEHRRREDSAYGAV